MQLIFTFYIFRLRCRLDLYISGVFFCEVWHHSSGTHMKFNFLHCFIQPQILQFYVFPIAFLWNMSMIFYGYLHFQTCPDPCSAFQISILISFHFLDYAVLDSSFLKRRKQWEPLVLSFDLKKVIHNLCM
jgi:hypothetical protein